MCCLPLLFAGCGGHAKSEESASAPKPTDVRLILDYLPNTIHVAFYSALDQGYYKRDNLNVDIVAPTSTTDTLRLMAA